MANRRNVLMLNGKRYDALTGRLLVDEHGDQSSASVKKPHHTSVQGHNIDGFKRQAAHAHPKISHTSIHHKPERSKTLMRSAVHKPTPAPAATVAARRAKPSPTTNVTRSHLISKFGTPNARPKPVPAVLAVKAPPEVLDEVDLLDHHHQTSLKPPRSAPANHIDTALEHATSHEQPRHKKTTRRHQVAKKLRVSARAVNIGASLIVMVILGGYFAYQNVPNLAVRIASARAGVAGGLPDYQPAGFSLRGPIQYQPGQINISYQSNSDDRKFHLTERSSSWNSETLLQNYVAINRRAYQTYQSSGKTIYIYDKNNATWVDEGVWYQIEGNSALSSDQLLRLANSL